MTLSAPPSRLLVVLDRPTCDHVGRSLIQLGHRLINAGARFFWYRNHSDGAGVMLKDAGALAPHVARVYGVMVVGDRLDVALVAGASGVHLPGHGLPVAAATRFVSLDHVGCSCHTVDEVETAARAGASYVTFSPIYPTSSDKSFVRTPTGLDPLREAAEATPCPVYALGGVTPDRVEACRAAGAWGVGVLGGILLADDPMAAVAAYLEALGEAA